MPSHFVFTAGGWTQVPDVTPHNFSVYAGRTPEQHIVLCSRCGDCWKSPDDDRDYEWVACEKLEGQALRAAFEKGIRRAQRALDFYNLAGDTFVQRKPGPAYQNVSAAINTIVGGWNRRGR